MIRIFSAFALAVPLLLVLWLAPSAVFFLVILIAVFFAGWECSSLLLLCGWRGRKWEVALDSAALVLAIAAGGLIAGLALMLIIVRLLLQALYAEVPREGILGSGLSILAVLWIGGSAGLFASLRPLPEGREFILFLLAVVWANDIGAYYVGRVFGRRKLAPMISPGKTVEGAAGGLALGAFAAAFIVAWMGDRISGGVRLLIPAALVLGVFSQVGDLFESLVKRAAGVKESGGLIPGHGGILDRIDGLLLAAPPLYYFLALTSAG